MRILWSSNGPHCPTGYGVQTGVFCPRIVDDLGHEMIVLNLYGLQGAPIKTDKFLMLPAAMDQWSNDVLVADYVYHECDVLITLMDAWVFREDQVARLYWAPWFPVDHDPMPPAVQNILRFADKPIVYSQFAMEKCKEANIQAVYVPHGVDMNRLRYVGSENAREERGVPQGVFLAGIVAANKGSPSRKAFEAQIRGFKKFHDKHPDSLLYIHSERTGVMHGEDLTRIVDVLGLEENAVAFVDQYLLMRGMLNDDYMSAMYSAMDVLLNATRGEGFGVPIIEAQACGTPAIVTDFSSMPELSFDGLLVKPRDILYNSQGSYQADPDADEIANLLEYSYKHRQELADKREDRVQWIRERYEADYVTQNYWRPVLDWISKEVDDLKAHSQQQEATRTIAPRAV